MPEDHSADRGTYRYFVHAEVIRPLGGNNYAAKVNQILCLRKAAPAEAMRLTVFHEHYGVDAWEAISKSVKDAEAWIDQQPKQSDDLR